MSTKILQEQDRRAAPSLFSATGLIPQTRPSRADIFSSIKIDYKLFTNILGVAVFAAFFALTMRRGITDPVCGMKVDKAKALQMDFAGETFYFCSEHCLHAFETNPAEHLEGRTTASKAQTAQAHAH